MSRSLAGSLSSACACVLALGCGVASAASTGFIENRGQIDERVFFYAGCPAGAVFFTGDGLVLDLRESTTFPATVCEEADRERARSLPACLGKPPACRGRAVRLRFNGASGTSAVLGRDPTGSRFHFFLGNDPAAWVMDARSFREVLYRGVWPGIDLAFHAAPEGIACEVRSSPGADTERIDFVAEGADAFERRAPGQWRIATAWGDWTLTCSMAAESGDGRVQAAPPWRDGVAAAAGPLSGPFVAGAADRWQDLLWSTFLGGSGLLDGTFSACLNRSPRWAARAAPPRVVLAGLTWSLDFPATPGAYDKTHDLGSDACVCELSAAGDSLIWSTFLGGDLNDCGYGVAVDDEGAIVVCGTTMGGTFPTTPGAYDRTANGMQDLFVAKLNARGSELLWSTYLGGSNHEVDYPGDCDLALDEEGCPIVTGGTQSDDYPTTELAFDRVFDGGYTDAYVTRLDPTGSSLVWSTYLGGMLQDTGQALAVAPGGDVIVAGKAGAGFPTTPGAYDPTFHGPQLDAFVTRIDASGQALVWSTFLGGAGGNDRAYGLVLDDAGHPTVTGYTRSADFPTSPGAWDEVFGGLQDAFVSQFDASGARLLWSTYLGGPGNDYGYGLALTHGRDVLVTGFTDDETFPVTAGSFDATHNGGLDAFVTRLASRGSALVWSTFLGGSAADEAYVVATDARGDPLVIGATGSHGFPTTPGAYDPTYNGGAYDIFVTKLEGTLPSRADCGGGSATTIAAPGLRPSGMKAAARAAAESACPVVLSVYDVAGRLVRIAVANESERFPTNNAPADLERVARGLGAGVYFYRLHGPGQPSRGRLLRLP